MKKLTFSACPQVERMTFWSNSQLSAWTLQEDFCFVPGPAHKGDHGLPYIV